MAPRQTLVLAIVVALIFVTPALAAVFEYAKTTHGGGDIKVTVDSSEVVTSMQVPTSMGRIVVTVTEGSPSSTYELVLSGTGEQIDMTLTDGGSGTTDVIVDYGTAGSVSFTLEIDDTLTLVSSSITNCSAITDSDIYAGLLIGAAAAQVAALDYKRTRPEKAHLFYVTSILGLVVNAVHVQTVECEPMLPNLWWGTCSYQPSYPQCQQCCGDATRAAIIAATWPCGAGGPATAAACAVAIAAEDIACDVSCEWVFPEDPPVENESCGFWPNYGNCLQWCPPGTHEGGGSCEVPTVCCVFD